jgi:hypothetical protein
MGKIWSGPSKDMSTKISAFYLVKQKSFIPKKYDLGRSQYALFTDPIFSDGFGFPFPATTTKAVTEATNLGPKLKDIGCRRPEDCSDVDGTYCDADLGFCLCKPDYPVTDTNHCYKGRDWA